MTTLFRMLKCAVAAALLSGPAFAQDSHLDDLFMALKSAESPEADQIVQKIGSEWSKSGSPSFDLLLERGRDAMEAGDTGRAIMHLSALVEQAPGFAEGWNARATAFFQDGEYGLALDDIRQVLILNPRHFGAMTGLAVILEEIGRPDGALTAWREVVAIYPASPQADRAITRLERETEGEVL